MAKQSLDNLCYDSLALVFMLFFSICVRMLQVESNALACFLLQYTSQLSYLAMSGDQR